MQIHKNKFVLFIDDEPSRIALIKWPSDTFVIPAHGFEQINYWLQLQKAIKFDLICCDHDMPLMNGIDVCREFLSEQSTKIIIHSMNPIAASSMAAILEEYCTPYEVISIDKLRKKCFSLSG